MTDQAERTFRLLMPEGSGGRITHEQIALMAGLFDELDVGLVSVDSETDFANVNKAAAELLAIPPGNTTANGFHAVMNDLAARAISPVDAAGLIRLVETDPSAEFKSTWVFGASPHHLGVVCKPAPYPGFTGRIWAFYDNSALAEAIEASDHASALLRASSDAMLDPQVLMEAVWRDGRVVDLIHRDNNKATCDYLGLSREQMIGRSAVDVMPSLEHSGMLDHLIGCAETGEPVLLDDLPLDNEILGESRYYDLRAYRAQPGWISVTWRDVTERSQLTRRIAESEERYRLLAENVADVVVRLDDDGTMTWISKSVEQVLGATADRWLGQKVFDFNPPERREEGRDNWLRIASAGTFIGRATVFDADDNPHTIHVHSKPFYNSDGQRDGLVGSFRIIDDEVAAEERARREIARRDRQNQSLTQLLQAQTDRLMSDMGSAAKYVASILPGDLDGPVRVSSRYVSSRELGGDSYDYRWIDDDHLLVYLLDVSGHGVEPAMVSVSVHNLLRSGSLPPEMLREPDQVLAELNRLFQMERQAGNYFTIWYGVYRASTRTLRYASAGHPPAIVLTTGSGAEDVTKLSTGAMPISVFEDTEFTAQTYEVPAGAEMLVYSDGAFELSLPDGRPWSLADFIKLCSDLATSPEWSLDDLIEGLRTISVSGVFDDDCTLVRLRIP